MATIRKSTHTHKVFEIICGAEACSRSAETLTIEILDDKRTQLIVSSDGQGERLARKNTEPLAAQVCALPQGGSIDNLHLLLIRHRGAYRRRVFTDGLVNFCRTCEEAYCSLHHSAFPVSWYCPKGHSKSIKD